MCAVEPRRHAFLLSTLSDVPMHGTAITMGASVSMSRALFLSCAHVSASPRTRLLREGVTSAPPNKDTICRRTRFARIRCVVMLQVSLAATSAVRRSPDDAQRASMTIANFCFPFVFLSLCLLQNQNLRFTATLFVTVRARFIARCAITCRTFHTLLCAICQRMWARRPF